MDYAPVGLHDKLSFTWRVYLSSLDHFPVVILEAVVMFTPRERQTLTAITPQPQQQQQYCYSLHISRVMLTHTIPDTSVMSLLHSVIYAWRWQLGDCSRLVNIDVTYVGRGHPTSFTMGLGAPICCVILSCDVAVNSHDWFMRLLYYTIHRPVSVQIL